MGVALIIAPFLFATGALAQESILKRFSASGALTVAANDELASGCTKNEYSGSGCVAGKTKNCFTITGCDNPDNNVAETCGPCH